MLYGSTWASISSNCCYQFNGLYTSAMDDPGLDDEEQRTYSLDELAAISGVPARTIRFYQAEKLLPSPERDRADKRVARYRGEHVHRLETILELQDRGLKIPAIRELLKSDRPDIRLGQWLGLDETLRGSWFNAHPEVLSRAELRRRTASLPRGSIGELERVGLIATQGDAWLVPRPDLLDLAIRMTETGLPLVVAVEAGNVLITSLRTAADQLIELFIESFASRLDEPDEVNRLMAQLKPIAEDAVQAMLAFEIERSTSALLDDPRRIRKIGSSGKT